MTGLIIPRRKEIAPADRGGARGPVLTRRGALRLSASSAATLALSTLSGGLSLALAAPEAALAQQVPSGGGISGLPACTIRTKHQLRIADAEFAADDGFFRESYNMKCMEDFTGGVSDVYNVGRFSERGGTYYSNDGDNTTTVYMTHDLYNRAWNWTIGSSTGFVLVWRSCGRDADGDFVDLWLYVHNFHTQVDSYTWYNTLNKDWGRGMPVFTTFDFEKDGVRHLIPSFEALAGTVVEADASIRLYKSSCSVACSKDAGYPVSSRAAGTYIVYVDDLDSCPADSGDYVTLGNKGLREYAEVDQGVDAYYRTPECTVSTYTASSGRTRFEAANVYHGEFQTLRNGAALATTPTGQSWDVCLRIGGDCYRTQLLEQRWYPLTLRTFPMARRETDEWPLAPGYYQVLSSTMGSSGVHMEDQKMEDGGAYRYSSAAYDHKSIFVLTPYYNNGDRGERSGWSGGYRLTSLYSGASHMDYWARADLSAVAAHNYSNNTENQRIELTEAADGCWYIHKGDQYLSGSASNPADFLGWGAKGLGGRDDRWQMAPWCEVADWAPDKLYCRYKVLSGSTEVASFTTDPSGYAYQVDSSSYGHNLPPGTYSLMLDYASWTSHHPSDNPIQNSSTFGHLEYFQVQRSPFPCNYLRAAVPMMRGHLRLTKYVRDSADTVPSGYYRVRSAIDSGYCLDVSGGGAYNGCNVQLYEDNGTRSQVWVVTNLDGYIQMSPAVNMALRLDISGGAKSGSNAQVWKQNGSGAQFLQPVAADGGFKLLFKGDPTVALDVKDGKAANYQNVQGYTANGTKAQTWVFEALSASAADLKLELPEGSEFAEDAASATGWSYGLYTDSSCAELAATIDGGGSRYGTPRTADGDEYLPYIGRPYWLKETLAADGCQKDLRAYKVLIPDASGTESHQVMSDVRYVAVADLPKVRKKFVSIFFYLVGDGENRLVESFTVPNGTVIDPWSASGEFHDHEQAAMAKMYEFWGVESISSAWTWAASYGDIMDTSGLADDVAKFNELSFGTDGDGSCVTVTATEDIFLYACMCKASVRYYVDGTDDEHLLMTDGPFYLGTRYEIPDSAAAAAAKEGCTPGFDGWFDSSRSKGFTSSTPVTKGAGYSPATFVLYSDEDLYGVNRATVSFALTTGSEEVPKAGEKYYASIVTTQRSYPVVPASFVQKVGTEVNLVYVASRSRLSTMYVPREDGRRRTLRPSYFYAAADGSGETSDWIKSLPCDTTRYIKWEYALSDGVVDKID